MGNSSSDDKKKKKDTKGNKKKDSKKKKDGEGGGDGFFGPFKWRVFVIGLLLIIFAILQLPLVSDALDGISDAKEACDSACDAIPDGTAKDACEDALDCSALDANLAALAFMELGLLCMMIGAICAIIINFLNCNDCCGNLDNCLLMFVMITLVGGGAAYLLGNLIYVGENETGITSALFVLSLISGAAVIGGTCDNFDADTLQNMIILITIVEALLAAVTAIVFGIDCWKQILNEHKKRMYWQSLILLIVVSFFGLIGYGYIGSMCSDGMDEPRLVAVGYAFICIACILYLVTVMRECGNKIQQMVSQLIIALILIVGGIFAGIGYWGNTYPDVDGAEEYNSYITGYVFLLVGLCVVNALDMGLYDNAKAAKTANSVKK